jgi:predicted porin
MKKQLLALAVAGAIAAPAMAQNVSVYGTIDTGINIKDSAGTKTNTMVNDDNYGSSVLGFKIAEDLGNGMKAFGQFEAGLRPGDGGTDKSTTLPFDEKSFIGISKGNTAFSFGRQGTAYDNHKSYANMGVNLFSDTDAIANDLAVPAANTTSLSTKVAGVGLQATYSAGADPIELTNTTVGSVALTYSVGGFDLAYATASSSDDVKEQTINVGTKLGGIDLKAQFMSHKEKNTASVDNRIFKLGAKYSMGAIDLIGSFQKANSETASEDERAFGVMAVYNLSKRTSTYVGYNSRQGTGTSTTDVVESTVGIQHKF